MIPQLATQIRDAKLGWVYWAVYTLARAKGKSVETAHDLAQTAQGKVKA